ncbi:MAG: GNAT family N-acetyltransferase [Treponemataceae bacterium]
MYSLKKISCENIFQVLHFLKKYEPLCVNLTNEILKQQKYFSLKKNEQKNIKNKICVSFVFLYKENILAVCALDRHKTFLHCFPKFDTKVLKKFFACAEIFFEKFFVKSIMGEKNFNNVLEKFLLKNYTYKIKTSTEYFLLFLNTKNFRSNFDAALPSECKVNCDVCTRVDLEKLLPLQTGYEREELGHTTPNDFFSRVYLLSMLKEQTIFKCELNNKIVAKAHTNAGGINCKQIGGVFTLPEWRGEKFAERVLSFAIKTLTPTTKTLVLFVKVKNIKAQKLYKRLGFEKIADFKIVNFTNE